MVDGALRSLWFVRLSSSGCDGGTQATCKVVVSEIGALKINWPFLYTYSAALFL